ncbi:Arc family DNA-binding protein [Serratia liquefaciens]
MKGMRNIAPFGLRMPDELRESITERAKANGRSINAEIVQMLEDGLSRSEDSMVIDQLKAALEARDRDIESMKVITDLMKQNTALYQEQIAGLKKMIKDTIGFDVQEYYDKTIDYDAIYAKYGLKYKKPT